MRQLVVLIPALLAALLVAAWALSDRNARPVADAVSITPDGVDAAGDYQRLQQMVDSLTEIVNFEVGERRRLEQKIIELEEKLGGSESDVATPTVAVVSETPVTRAAPGRGARRGGISEERLVAAGFPPDTATRLKQRMDEIAMERLYLRDTAVREGWLGSQRYRDELRALNERQGSIRDDLSPADYDRYLYALGRPNRVTVNNVLSGSPADQAGLQAGDQILSYDGQRVFNSGEIRRATTSGLAGQSVAVEVERDGQTQVLYLPRGPLGVQMGSTVTPP